ncbi:MAG TPA: hypothetical protein VEJ36_08040, partial [Nitrososphaerales archaeon]|nr:hypothetical protein [Nitrososphaerales archaeon]
MRRSDVPVFACLLLLVASNGVQLARASSTIDLEASNGATVCPVAPFYGVWNSTSSTCFITGAVSFASGSTVQIGSNVTLNVEQEGSISLSGALEAGGTVYDYGGIIIGSTGSLVTSGNFGVQIGATLDNFGLINDTQNGMPVWGVLTNEAGGEIYVSSTGGMASLGVIANYGTVLNHGHFDAKPISEPLTTPGDIENFASVVNLNSISIGGRFTNEGDGLVVNSASGTGQGFSIACFTPEEFPGILATCGSFTNDGTFNNTSTGGMSVISNVTAINSGEMSNGGTLNVYSVFNNTATISNTGNIGIGPNGTMNNEAGGSVNNAGSIVVQCGGSALLGQFNNMGTLTGNPVAAAQGCQVSSSAILSNGA